MRKVLLAAVLMPALLFTSCQKQAAPDANESGQTIATLLASLSVNEQQSDRQLRNNAPRQATFQLLSYAIVRSGLTNELDDPKAAFTLFAPTDDAFAAANLGTTQAIDNVPVATLRAVLLYHGLGSRVLSTQVPANTNTEITMLSNQKAYVNRRNGMVFINGAMVVSADIRAKNGVIHAINRVLFPPAGNIVQVASANENFTYLVAALGRASTIMPNLVNALQGAGPFTVFAPTNQAFINAGFPTIQSIESAPASSLQPILQYHVITARVFSSDLSNGLTPTMLNNQQTLITLTSGAQIKGNANNMPSNITQTDLMATNGVIHVIDRVLLPQP